MLMPFRVVPPRLVSQTETSRSGWRYGSGSSITVAHDAEDRGRRADAERQRDQRRRGEAGRPAQHAHAVADVAHRVLEQRRPDFIARALSLTRSTPPNLITAWRRASSASMPARRFFSVC